MRAPSADGGSLPMPGSDDDPEGVGAAATMVDADAGGGRVSGPGESRAGRRPRGYAVTPRTAAVAGERVTDDLLSSSGDGSRTSPLGPVLRHKVARWGVRASVVGVVGVALLSVAYLTLPTATITLVPRLVQLPERRVSIVASPNTPVVDVVAGTIPATRRQYLLTRSATFDVATIRDALTRASGSVRFGSQNTVTDVLVDTGTRLWSRDGMTYRTLEPVTLPRWDRLKNGSIPTMEVRVLAVKPGPEANARAGSITRVSATLDALHVTVTNPAAITGGTRQPVREVSNADCNRARKTLRTALQAELDAELQKPATPGLHLFPESAQLGTMIYSPDCATLVGQRSDAFELGASTTATALEVDESVLEATAAEHARAKADPAMHIDADTVRVAAAAAAVVTHDSVTYSMAVTAGAQLAVDPSRVREEVAGRSVRDAQAVLDSYGAATLVIWPDFVPDVPQDVGRITLIVKPREPGL